MDASAARIRPTETRKIALKAAFRRLRPGSHPQPPALARILQAGGHRFDPVWLHPTNGMQIRRSPRPHGWRANMAAMEQGTRRARLDRDTRERIVSLRRQLGVSTFGMNQIVLQPRQRGRIHRHERQEEVYLVLEGELTLLVEGEEMTLRQGELIRVAPALRRQLVNLGPRPLVMLALGGDGEHHGRDGEAFESWEDESGVAPQELPLPRDLPPS